MNLSLILQSLKKVLQFIWAAPVSVPSFIFYILPCWLLGWYYYQGKTSTAVYFVISSEIPTWLENLWEPWNGQCVGNFIVLRNSPQDSPKAYQTLVHELEHTRQIMTWGILQPLFYLAAKIALKMSGEDSYRFIPFEIAARRAAGQRTGLDENK